MVDRRVTSVLFLCANGVLLKMVVLVHSHSEILCGAALRGAYFRKHHFVFVDCFNDFCLKRT